MGNSVKMHLTKLLILPQQLLTFVLPVAQGKTLDPCWLLYFPVYLGSVSNSHHLVKRNLLGFGPRVTSTAAILLQATIISVWMILTAFQLLNLLLSLRNLFSETQQSDAVSRFLHVTPLLRTFQWCPNSGKKKKKKGRRSVYMTSQK